MKSAAQDPLQTPQEVRRLLVRSQPGPGVCLWAEQLQSHPAQEQAVEVLPVQELLHVLQEESFTEPAELGCVMELRRHIPGKMFEGLKSNQIRGFGRHQTNGDKFRAAECDCSRVCTLDV